MATLGNLKSSKPSMLIWNLRQNSHAAVWVNEKLDPVAGLQAKMLPDSLRDCSLALDGER